MPRMTGKPYGQGAFASSATAVSNLGQLGEGTDGRKYRYVKAGAVTLVVGNALQSRVEDTDHDNITVVTGAVGERSLTITTGSGSGALDANEYANGWAVIDTTPGLGYSYKITSHPAIAASTNGVITLEEPIQVVLSASSKVTLVASPWDGVIQHPVTTASGVTVGGCIYPIAANEYGWIQTGGPGAALIAGTPGVGQPVTAVGAVAGALSVHSAELSNVAYMMVTGRNTIVCPVFWLID